MLRVGGWRVRVGSLRLRVGGWSVRVGGYKLSVGGSRLMIEGWMFIPGQSCKEEGFLDFLSAPNRARIP